MHALLWGHGWLTRHREDGSCMTPTPWGLPLHAPSHPQQVLYPAACCCSIQALTSLGRAPACSCGSLGCSAGLESALAWCSAALRCLEPGMMQPLASQPHCLIRALPCRASTLSLPLPDLFAFDLTAWLVCSAAGEGVGDEHQQAHGRHRAHFHHGRQVGQPHGGRFPCPGTRVLQDQQS